MLLKFCGVHESPANALAMSHGVLQGSLPMVLRLEGFARALRRLKAKLICSMLSGSGGLGKWIGQRLSAPPFVEIPSEARLLHFKNVE